MAGTSELLASTRVLKAAVNETVINPFGQTNEITTSKYTLLSWLPKSLLEQFRRIANVYFLAISMLMLIGTYAPYIFQTPLEPFSTLGTLVIVLLITSVKEGLEDLQRHKSDDYDNNRPVSILQFQDVHDHVNCITVIKKCSEVKTGDIVIVPNETVIPVDLIVLRTAHCQDGNQCYIETANIDGETNLKVRQAPTPLKGLAIDESLLSNREATISIDFVQDATIESELPNKNIHTFVGTLRSKSFPQGIPLGPDNILLRGAFLANTSWVVGIAVFTGDESKIMMNSKQARSKLSTLEIYVNYAIKIIFLAQILLVALIVIISSSFNPKLPYVYPDGDENSGIIIPHWLENAFVFFLLFNNFIPISLYVTIELVNIGQAYMMGKDLMMYDKGLDCPCIVRSSNLAQELGLVTHLFSDKTGTLTRNEMKFIQCCVGPLLCELREDDDDGKQDDDEDGVRDRANTSDVLSRAIAKSLGFVPTQYIQQLGLAEDDDDLLSMRDDRLKLSRSKLAKLMNNYVSLKRLESNAWDSSETKDSEAPQVNPMISMKAAAFDVLRSGRQSMSIKSPVDPTMILAENMFTFFETLVTCHSVMLDKDGYRAESPDELALLYGISPLGFSMSLRSTAELAIKLPTNLVKVYKILAVNQFNSTRKRMSVLIQEKIEGSSDKDQLYLVCKGADAMVLDRCSLDERARIVVEKQLSGFSKQGLRTLVVARKVVSQREADDWLQLYNDAMLSVHQRDDKLAAVAEGIEQRMIFLGVTAVEDRLQDEVPETIQALAQAGITIWMLTGDKRETAMNIGNSCHLLRDDMCVLNVTGCQTSKQTVAKLHEQIIGAKLLLAEKFEELKQKKKKKSRISGSSFDMFPTDRQNWQWKSNSLGIGITSTTNTTPTNKSTLTEPPKSPKNIEIVSSIATSPYSNLAGIETLTPEKEKQSPPSALATLPKEQKKIREIALVIDGASLALVQDRVDVVEDLLELTNMCSSVIACRYDYYNDDDDDVNNNRVSPSQKALLVRMIKTNGMGTLTAANEADMDDEDNDDDDNDKVYSNRYLLTGWRRLWYSHWNPIMQFRGMQIKRRRHERLAARHARLESKWNERKGSEIDQLFPPEAANMLSANRITLAVGDGANDVGMIQEAHVGIGIMGKEGKQAVNSSDFAIAQFKFLRNLLLVHGRWNYIRQSNVFLYSMHKNMVLTITLFYFSFLTALSGTSMFESLVYTAFNFALGLPIIFYGFLDKDVSYDFAYHGGLPGTDKPRHNLLYASGRLNSLLNSASISLWILNAFLYATVLSAIYFISMYDSFEDYGLFSMGTTVYTGMVTALQFKICLMTNTWTFLTVIMMFVSIFGYFLFIYVYSNPAFSIDFAGEANFLYGQDFYWIVGVILIPIGCATLIDTLGWSLRALIAPNEVNVCREFEMKQHLKASSEHVQQMASGSCVDLDRASACKMGSLCGCRPKSEKEKA